MQMEKKVLQICGLIHSLTTSGDRLLNARVEIVYEVIQNMA